MGKIRQSHVVRPIRFALSTLWDGNERFRCAFPLWCRSAHIFSETSRLRPSIVILKRNGSVAQGCPGARSYWPEDIVEAMRGYVARYRKIGGMAGWYVKYLHKTILKLAIFSLTEFDVVLFADLDVDVHSRWRPKGHRWRRHLDSFVRDPDVYLAANSDSSAPVNTAVMLAKPRRWLHNDTLQVLRSSLSFDPVYGFDRVGRPRTLAINIRRLAEGSFGSGSTGLTAAQTRLNVTAAYSRNNWAFVGGSIDQGLFWYLFYVRRDVGTWTTVGRGAHLEHWYGSGGKPWRPGVEARWHRQCSSTARYLWRVVEADATSEDDCLRMLYAKMAYMKRNGTWLTHRKAGFSLLDRRQWLPRPAPAAPAGTSTSSR